MGGVPATGRTARLLMSLLRVGTPEFWSIYEYLGIKSFGLWSQMGVWSQMGIIEEPRSYSCMGYALWSMVLREPRSHRIEARGRSADPNARSVESC